MGQLMDDVAGFVSSRHAELASAYAVGLKAYNTKTLPDMSDVSGSTIVTTVAAMVIANTALMSLTSGGRKVIADAINAVITLALLIVLILLVLGVPVGFTYTAFVGLRYAWVFASPFILEYGGAAVELVKAKMA